MAPSGQSEKLPAVVQDFEECLQDLKWNSDVEITNLTNIAAEHAVHAEAISSILENHIRRTTIPPLCRLYALYLLDSIIRHAGPPYPSYLTRNLFGLFMETYRANDKTTRKSMEILAKSWLASREGSNEPSTVPPAISGAIWDGLMQWHRPGPDNQPVPIANPYGPVVLNSNMLRSHSNPGHNHAAGPMPEYPQGHTPPPANHVPLIRAPSTEPSAVSISQADLKLEIQAIHDSASLKRILEPDNHDVIRLVDTLQQLKHMLDTTIIPPSDLSQMRDQLLVIKAKLPPQISSILGGATAPVHPTHTLPTHTANPYLAIPTPPPPMANYAPPPANHIPASFDINTIFNMMKPVQAPTLPVSVAQVPILPQYPSPPVENPLIAQLRAAGLLSVSPAPPQIAQIPVPNVPRGPLDQDLIDQPRPELMRAMLHKLSDQCRKCGRRFAATDEGRRQKTRHLDWHYHVNARLADATRSTIVYRSLYLNEQQWSTLHERLDMTEDEAANANLVEANSKIAWVPQPSDPALLKQVCPVCMDPFTSEWDGKTQQYIWMDAKQVQGKYYHATCWDQMNSKKTSRGRMNGLGGGTPEPLLGKRKLEAQA